MRSKAWLAGFRSTRRPCAAQRALKHWEAAGQAAPERVAEYRQILTEVEAEALAILEALEGK